MGDLFTEEDFYPAEVELTPDLAVKLCAEIANAKFREWLEGQPKVYRSEEHDVWAHQLDRFERPKSSAYLVDIKEIGSVK